MENVKVKNLTISFFIDTFLDEFAFQVWNGVYDNAKKHDVNLICFHGGCVNDPAYSFTTYEPVFVSPYEYYEVLVVIDSNFDLDPYTIIPEILVF